MAKKGLVRVCGTMLREALRFRVYGCLDAFSVNRPRLYALHVFGFRVRVSECDQHIDLSTSVWSLTAAPPPFCDPEQIALDRRVAGNISF